MLQVVLQFLDDHALVRVDEPLAEERVQVVLERRHLRRDALVLRKAHPPLGLRSRTS